jgi:hypothetical protein
MGANNWRHEVVDGLEPPTLWRGQLVPGAVQPVPLIPDSDQRTIITFRAPQELVAQVDEVVEEEGSSRRKPLTRSKVCAFLLGLGLDAYRAMAALNGRLDAACKAHGWSRRDGLRHVLERGLESLEKERKARK